MDPQCQLRRLAQAAFDLSSPLLVVPQLKAGIDLPHYLCSDAGNEISQLMGL